MNKCECGCGKTPNARKRYIMGHHLIGRKSHNSHGGRMKNNKGYWLVYIPEHPYCNNNGYVFEHRLVMENRLGRYLIPNELVHHLNGKPYDNRIENLQLINSKGEHRGIHNKLDKTIDMSSWICSRCNRNKTSLKKSGRPKWVYLDGERLCNSCYSTERRRKIRLGKY